MALINKSISTRIDVNGYSQVLFRINVNRDKRFRFRTGIFVPTKQWNEKDANLNIPKVYATTKDRLVALSFQKECQDLKTKIDALENKIARLCDIEKADTISNEWLEMVLPLCDNIEVSKLTSELLKARLDAINTTANEDKRKAMTFFELFSYYIDKQQHSYDEIKGHYTILRLLQRYQYFVQQTDDKNFRLDIETFNAGIIEDFESYARNEYKLFHEYSSIFKSMPKTINEKKRSPEPQQRGDNTIIKFKKKLNAFFHWLNKMDITQNRPFEKVVIGAEKYGTPYYLSLEERNTIADYDFSYNKHLDTQRDIFIFQCLIGCRVGDLVRMTRNNVINGAVEYIPNKTKDGRPNLVRVPLNDRAKAIINKYKDIDTPSLFPFISTQKYNDSIKDILTICKINRMVTILNPTTGNEEQLPINEIASSHMARRTFIGNLYKQVKDPNLVGSLSGHSEGSKAFARYRDIDEAMKKDLVSLLE